MKIGRNNSAFKLKKLGPGAGSACFSILRVAKKAAERIKHGKSVPILKPKKEANRRVIFIGGSKNLNPSGSNLRRCDYYKDLNK